MDTAKILFDLRTERDRMDRAISALKNYMVPVPLGRPFPVRTLPRLNSLVAVL
jgi:hypothetical protein